MVLDREKMQKICWVIPKRFKSAGIHATKNSAYAAIQNRPGEVCRCENLMDALAISGVDTRELPPWAQRFYLDADLPGEDESWPWPQAHPQGSYNEGIYTPAAAPPSHPAIVDRQAPVPPSADAVPYFVPSPAAVVFSKHQSMTSKPMNNDDDIDYFDNDDETIALINTLFTEFDFTDADPQTDGNQRGFQPLPSKTQSIYSGYSHPQSSNAGIAPVVNTVKSDKGSGEAAFPRDVAFSSQRFKETRDFDQILIRGAKEYPHRISTGLLKLEIGSLAYQYLLLHYFAPSSIALIAEDYRSLAGNRSGFQARLEERGILPGIASFISFIMECSAAVKDQGDKFGSSGNA
ncbi:hypothetical protein M407DRAFT_229900 [Tulasnella calospora MUT 4182]|uniref:Uncharacterized protein n=1 Tax=Tulasnella calospora MUT 4182 TaxID=1051891 RepID=A0A0C3Q386_9AGAM|nr:hypothetical protein M407DRAFT_229900 [Tulasnella calospora MUT 4182]